MKHGERTSISNSVRITYCGKIIAEPGQIPRMGYVVREAIVNHYDAPNLMCSVCISGLAKRVANGIANPKRNTDYCKDSVSKIDKTFAKKLTEHIAKLFSSF